MNAICRTLLTASCVCSVWAGSYFSGALISITLDTDPNPICVGVAVTYTANDDGTAPTTYKWEYRCTEGGAAGGWVTAPAVTKSVTFVEGYVGSQDVTCTGQYEAMGQNPAHVSIVYRQINVHGPDRDVIDENTLGQNSTGYPEMILWAQFCVYCGEFLVGGGVNGYPQEWIRDPQHGIDTGWIPSAPTSNFFFQNGCIYDRKRITIENQADWDSRPIGNVIIDNYQRNRMVIKNCHGQDVNFEFPERHFQYIKTSSQTFQMVLVP